MTEPVSRNPGAGAIELQLVELLHTQAQAGSIWLVPGVKAQPQVTLEDWRVMRLTDRLEPATSTVYLVGREVPQWEGRVSSAVVHIDRITMRARTASGRLYELSGSPGYDDDGMYVWNRTLTGKWSPERVTCDDITDDPTQWPQADAGSGP